MSHECVVSSVPDLQLIFLCLAEHGGSQGVGLGRRAAIVGKLQVGDHRRTEVTLTGVPEAMLREAMQLHRQNRVPEAIEAYQRILVRWPRQADTWFNLAVLQRQARRLDDALDSYQKALDAGVARPEEAHLNRSVIYTDYLRQHAAAEHELRLALSLNPAFSPALLNLGNLCEDLGRREEALALYARILALEPHSYEALARYSNVQPRGRADRELTERLGRAIADPAASAAERASLGFALGRALDEAAEYPAAFGAYRAANQASRASAAANVACYDRTRQQAWVDRLIASGTAPGRAPSGAAGRPRPIFICGMFRSGSTLAEQLLAGCPGVAAGGELDFLPRLVQGELAPFPESLAALSAERLATIAARYHAELARVSQHALYVIDKRPENFLYIGLIKSMFPDARIVHTIRNPLDNCLSIYFLHLNQQMSYALDLMDIGHYFREYRRLMAHWKTTFSADIFDFDYDALVSEPESTLQRLCAFLELEWEGRVPQAAQAGQAIKTASVWQVREPLYRSSSGRAQHYASELTDLRDYLADLLPA
jgi:tetratricopeptide (TPR) repeat protein